MNNAKERILLLLLGGLAFGCSYTPGKQWMVLKTISREWSKLDKKELREGINYLYRLELIDKKNINSDSSSFFLTKKGKLRALCCAFEDMQNRKTKWDGKWRMVAFDIPEKHRTGRNALRSKLKSIGFRQLQQSVFITPYDCEREIGLLVNVFDLERYVRFGILEKIDNEKQFIDAFNVVK